MITYSDFERVDIRVGRIISVADVKDTRRPSYKLEIDFGREIGIKKSIGQFVNRYSEDELNGLLVACVINLPVRQIGTSVSEVLTLGFPDKEGSAVLITPTYEVELGGKLF